MFTYRFATESDYNEIWGIIEKVISTADSYVFAPSSSRQKLLNYWCNNEVQTYVVCDGEVIVGTFLLRDNQPDLGSHVVNAAFMTRPGHGGKGIGRFMAESAIDLARQSGYKGMQFNFVIKSNQRAVQLWLKLGFSIVGEIPEAFAHPTYGLTNVYVMYKKL